MASRYVPHGRDSPRVEPHQFRPTRPIMRRDFLDAFDEMRAAYLAAIGGNEHTPQAKPGDGYVTMPRKRKTKRSPTTED